MKTLKIQEIESPIAFLNGTTGLFGPEYELCKQFNQVGKEAFEIGGLFDNPERLYDLINNGVKTIAIQTTGQNQEDIEKALDFFDSINYIPKAIILLFPDNLWCEARDFKLKHPETLILEHDSLFTGDFTEIEF